MEVKILHSIASPTFSYKRGQIVSIQADLAEKWKKTGICELIPEPTPEVVEVPVAKKTKK